MYTRRHTKSITNLLTNNLLKFFEWYELKLFPFQNLFFLFFLSPSRICSIRSVGSFFFVVATDFKRVLYSFKTVSALPIVQSINGIFTIILWSILKTLATHSMALNEFDILNELLFIVMNSKLFCTIMAPLPVSLKRIRNPMKIMKSVFLMLELKWKWAKWIKTTKLK